MFYRIDYHTYADIKTLRDSKVVAIDAA